MHATLPHATLQTRVRIDDPTLENPFEWCTVTTSDICAGRRIVIFAVPAAFSPTCSDEHLPGFEQLYDDIRAQGIDDVYCLSVNDSFVMNAWKKSQDLKNVEVIPDGSGEFTRKMGMLVCKDNLGFGMRSWRYAAVVEDGVVTKWFEEPGYEDNCASDPYGESAPQNLLENV